jgi:hypothetical protein
MMFLTRLGWILVGIAIRVVIATTVRVKAEQRDERSSERLVYSPVAAGGKVFFFLRDSKLRRAGFGAESNGVSALAPAPSDACR